MSPWIRRKLQFILILFTFIHIPIPFPSFSPLSLPLSFSFSTHTLLSLCHQRDNCSAYNIPSNPQNWVALKSERVLQRTVSQPCVRVWLEALFFHQHSKSWRILQQMASENGRSTALLPRHRWGNPTVWQSRAMNSGLRHFSKDYASNLLIQHKCFPVTGVNYFSPCSFHFPLRTFSCRK